MIWVLLVCIICAVIFIMCTLTFLYGVYRYIKDGLYKEDFYIFDRKGVR